MTFPWIQALARSEWRRVVVWVLVLAVGSLGAFALPAVCASTATGCPCSAKAGPAPQPSGRCCGSKDACRMETGEPAQGASALPITRERFSDRGFSALSCPSQDASISPPSAKAVDSAWAFFARAAPLPVYLLKTVLLC
jgi:hypothetical protein